MSEVLVVTGGSRGIGAAVARLAAQRGYAVCISYLSQREAVRRMSTRHGGSGGAIVNLSSRASRLGSPNE